METTIWGLGFRGLGSKLHKDPYEGFTLEGTYNRSTRESQKVKGPRSKPYPKEFK